MFLILIMHIRAYKTKYILYILYIKICAKQNKIEILERI
jgi:hypothetical protein